MIVMSCQLSAVVFHILSVILLQLVVQDSWMVIDRNHEQNLIMYYSRDIYGTSCKKKMFTY